jgi:hypothetical protein
MVRSSKVNAHPSLSSILTDNDVVEEEEDIITGMFKVSALFVVMLLLSFTT